ncbi:transcription factor bHLH30-like [Dendrobium catenatum]|uniref:Transcription factor bHLH107 n=1 Tax=Dendrobium catenatum TaxID=906689 RepID=A0A2I0VXH8_9ASPA|nr:transcription factor bHLH30-like [Dendrobium catenatum]PKU68113.1 Putative transcription factor bHLH107 [Dendrobium catenatum]
MDSVPLGDFRAFGRFLDGGMFGVGSSSVASLILDGESGELVRAPVKLGKKGGAGAADLRSAMALKSHSEAERRRRERINGHLMTLRRMTPCTDKLDKAGLLAEVINHIKNLKSDAIEISKFCTIPSDTDELRVEVDGEGANNSSFSVKASFCCDDRPELLADLKHTLESLQLKTISAEISSLGGRVKFVFVMTGEGVNNDLERHLFTTSIHQALKSVLDRASCTDFLPNACFSGKRRRISPFESSSSSS